jgi:hypothetical protein
MSIFFWLSRTEAMIEPDPEPVLLPPLMVDPPVVLGFGNGMRLLCG